MKIWICIPVFNRIEFTLKCLITIKAQTYNNFTVVICDHGSTDGTTARINQDFHDVVVLNADSRLWWTGAMNCCVSYVLQYAGAKDYLFTLNNDTELPPDYLAQLAAKSRKYPDAILTSVIYDIATGDRVSIGHRQYWLTAKAKALTFEKDHLPGDNNVIAVSYASGRGTLFPVRVFRQLGLYDEQHLPHYFADYDFSHKAHRAGFPIYVCSDCRVFSYVDATGMTEIRNRFSFKSFINYFTSIKSPANLKGRWWYGWNNCPKAILPIYITMDILRIAGSYFKYFLITKMNFKHSLILNPVIGPLVIFLFRTKIILSFLIRKFLTASKWLFASKETTNLTYNLTALNEQYLATFIADIADQDYQTVLAYFNELENDEKLIRHIEMQISNSKWSVMADKEARFGRRKGWYALVRILKPKVVIETGVDKGLGACVITSALMKNKAEGFDGYYYGTDINPKAGYLLSQQYKEFGEILYGDSIDSLKKFDKQIDIFINDSDHSPEYEADEYHVIKDKLSSKSMILGDNSAWSDKLLKFSLATQRNFLFFQEQPANHWFPGEGIGVAFKK